MKAEEIKSLFDSFESIAIDYDGVECWSAREIAPVMGYSLSRLAVQSWCISDFSTMNECKREPNLQTPNIIFQVFYMSVVLTQRALQSYARPEHRSLEPCNHAKPYTHGVICRGAMYRAYRKFGNDYTMNISSGINMRMTISCRM